MSTDSHAPGLLTIGWKEYVSFPEWGVQRLRAKVDTGACVSALDVADSELVETPSGPIARLRLKLSRGHGPERTVIAPVLRTTVVRNSAGARERRLVIEALLRLGPVEKRIALTITRRPGMRFRMLLGRAALAGSFVVDVGQAYVLKG
jgi:hypothetical protein